MDSICPMCMLTLTDTLQQSGRRCVSQGIRVTRNTPGSSAQGSSARAGKIAVVARVYRIGLDKTSRYNQKKKKIVITQKTHDEPAVYVLAS
jgi:hypothetical protein